MTNQRYSRVKMLAAGIVVFLGVQILYQVCSGEDYGSRSDFRKKVEGAFKGIGGVMIPSIKYVFQNQ
ncbi:MAG: hypothetical protein KKF30_11380 [Proteobacteria bacterium]|nr:hypothetical protein [Pseudomonadota bacterium]MBU4471218.1 hypothetical protein [Pseudomonadota bacterium]MCG2753193.1 hypothetical protein [Desulfobacteraceae bacterium]